MAKDLVRTRNFVTRFIEMKTHLNAVSLKMQVIYLNYYILYLSYFNLFGLLSPMKTIKSHDAMAQAMKGVTKALTKLNAKISLPGLQKVSGISHL